MRSYHLSSLTMMFLFVCILFVGTLFAGVSFWFSQSILKDQMQNTFLHHGQVLEITLEEKLSRAQYKLRKLSQSADLKSALEESDLKAIDFILTSFHIEKELGFVDQISVHNIQGNLTGNSFNQSRFGMISKGDFFVDNALMFDDWHMERSQSDFFKGYAIVTVLPIVDRLNGRLIGSLNATILLDHKSALISDLKHDVGLSELAIKLEDQIIKSDNFKSTDSLIKATFANDIIVTDNYFSKLVPIEQSPLATIPSSFIPVIERDQLDELSNSLIFSSLIALFIASLVAFAAMIYVRKVTRENAAGFVSDIKALARGEVKSDNLIKSPVNEFNRVARIVGKTLEKLNSEKEQKEAYLQLMKTPVLVWDRKGRIKEFNSTAKNLLSIPENGDECYLGDILPKMTIPVLFQKCAMHRALDGEFIEDFETQTVNNETGQAHTFLWSVSPVLSKKTNEVTCCIAQGVDVTRLRKLENSYLNQPKRFDRLTDMLVDLTWETNAAHQISTLCSPNNVFDKGKFRYFLDETFWNLHPGDQCHTIQNTCALTKEIFEKKMDFQNLEVCLSDDAGGHFVLRLYAQPRYDSEQNFIGYSGIAQNITEDFFQRLKLNEAIEKAQKASKAKSNFLSSMSHELRTPLNGILGFAQLMQMSKKETLTDRQSGFVNQITKSGNHLLELVNSVLDLAKIESNKIDLRPEVIKPSSMLEEIKHMLEPIALEANISIKFGRLENDDDYVYADFRSLKQVLVNLGSNAIKYNSPNGHLIFHCFKEADQNFLTFQVEDNGYGIDQEVMEHIFQPFSRLENENLTIEGTGIGLTITRQLLELMDGSITLESEKGKGSIFTFKLPSFDPEKNKVHKEKKKPLVLYVEDNPSAGLLMEEAFSQYGKANLKMANNAQKGLNILSKDQPDLILLDINLPGMSGIEMLGEIKKDDRLKDIPVVAVSAHFTENTADVDAKNAFSDFLPKPFKLNALYKTIDRYVKSEELTL